jgi:hypothetical protein
MQRKEIRFISNYIIAVHLIISCLHKLGCQYLSCYFVFIYIYMSTNKDLSVFTKFNHWESTTNANPIDNICRRIKQTKVDRSPEKTLPFPIRIGKDSQVVLWSHIVSPYQETPPLPVDSRNVISASTPVPLRDMSMDSNI